MRKFEFRLRPVLERAQRREQRRQLELAHLQGELTAHQDLLRALRDERSVWLCQLLECQQRSFEIDEMRRRRAHLDSLTDAIDDQRAVVGRLRQQVEDAQAAVVAAMRERQMLENLRDKQQLEHVQAAHRLETKLLDDLATPRFGRVDMARGDSV
jgi:flagellar FliJ protein